MNKGLFRTRNQLTGWFFIIKQVLTSSVPRSSHFLNLNLIPQAGRLEFLSPKGRFFVKIK